MTKQDSDSRKDLFNRNAPCCMRMQRQSISMPTKTRDSSTVPLTSKVIDSSDLFAGLKELVIRHGDQEYRLRITKQDKLILTK